MSGCVDAHASNMQLRRGEYTVRIGLLQAVPIQGAEQHEE